MYVRLTLPTMDKGLPAPLPLRGTREPKSARKHLWRLALAALTLLAVTQWSLIRSQVNTKSTVTVPLHASEILDKCRLLNVKPGPPEDFNLREYSDRFVPGTKATLIKVIHTCGCSAQANAFKLD